MTSVIDNIARILSDHSVVLPTLMYNEGWLLRIVLDWYFRRAKTSPQAIFHKDSRWFSEGRLSSQFLARFRGDKLAEAHTSADGIVGHFEIVQRSEIRPSRNAKQLLILEAKLSSKLSTGTRRAPGYDQAARSVACLAHISDEAGLSPGDFSNYGFNVIVPHKRLSDFTALTAKDSIKRKVEDRVTAFGSEKLVWYNETFLPHLEAMDVRVIKWENLLDDMESKGAERKYRDFYMTCCKYANL